MPSTCQQLMKDGKDRYGAWRFAPCGKVCDQGERFCPRHIMLNALAEKQKADKERAKRAANTATTRTSARR